MLSAACSCRCWSRLVVALAWLAVCLAEPCWTGTPKDTAKPRAKFTLGRDTTFFTEPLDKDGYVDYASALNAYFGKGVKPEENAYVSIITVLGPSPEGGMALPNSFFQALGIEPLPADGEYFRPLYAYLTQVEKLPPQTASQAEWQRGAASIYPWSADDYPLVTLWLRHNDKFLEQLEPGLRRPRCFRPLIASEKLHGSQVPDLWACRELASAYLARAMLRTQHGLYQLAWNDLLAAKRLGSAKRQAIIILES